MNKKLASFFCDPKTAVKNTALFLLMVFLLVYVFFQILPNFTGDIETETALSVTVHHTDKTTGYIFRDEIPVKSTDGKAVTLVKDGERVSKGQLFANVYTEESSADYQEEINAIDRKIEILSKSVVDTDLYVTDISKTDKEIEENFDTLFALIAEGSLSEALSAEKALLVSMNKKDLIINVKHGYQKEIDTLYIKRANIQSRIRSVSRQLYAQEAGYFYGDADGYEQIFTPTALKNLTLDSFRALTAMPPEETLKDSAFGKIVKDFVWYTVCKTDRATAQTYEKGYSYRLTFPAFSNDEIVMELLNIVSVTSEQEALLVFRGNTAPEGFPYARVGETHIVREGYSGLAVPKKAVRIVKGEPGVFVLDGDIVRFRYVHILTENDDYYIVSSTAPKTEEGDSETETDMPVKRYISLYDSIIVGGKNLFDGKTVG